MMDDRELRAAPLSPGPGTSVSLRSDSSKDPWVDFKIGPRIWTLLTRSVETRSFSLRSHPPCDPWIHVERKPCAQGLLKRCLGFPLIRSWNESGLSFETLRSDWSMGQREDFSSSNWDPFTPEVPSYQQQHTELDSTFKLLKEDIFTFVQNELNKFQKTLSSDDPECLEPVEGEDEEMSIREAFLKITVNFLRRREKKNLAERLCSRSRLGVLQRKLKSVMQQKVKCVFEGVAKAGNLSLLEQIYTELCITEEGASEVKHEHEVNQMESACKRAGQAKTAITCEDIFKSHEDTKKPIRTVLTMGMAGIGKTLLTQKFTLDWAEGRANQDIQLLFPFSFRELNVLKNRHFSLVELLHHCFSETKRLSSFEDLQLLFILDGLDECRLQLDFRRTRVITDPTESASVEELLVNLIRGDLLLSTLLWITTRPAAANQIPPECVSIVTEVQGFNNRQKEQYFRNKIKDEQWANDILKHIKSIRSLFAMCDIPIFCWILSTVLLHLKKTREREELPKTLTQMYIHFLVVQAKVKNIKYNEGLGEDFHWTEETKKMVWSLGKLAFEQLRKINLIFYESDLRECELDAAEIARYSGVFTQVFREELCLYQDKVYCFIHLTVQEFLAALHVHQAFINTGVNLLSGLKGNAEQFYQTAVDLALKSPNGQLDLFLRFLLGLSLPTNQSLLQGLLSESGRGQICPKTAEYIKQKLNEEVSAERGINLIHCLNELNDHTLKLQIQLYLNTGRLSESELSPAHWSALANLLSSEEDLDQFELQKYFASEETLLRLLPVLKASNKALLSRCFLSDSSCGPLSSILSSSHLAELDLSNNDLKDSGLKVLCDGLKSPHCTLQKLSLSGCLISEDGCAALASALRSNPSHLTHLDLSYNHPGDRGIQLLSALQADPRNSLNTLRLEPSGSKWLTPGLRKYFCELSLDPNTAHGDLKLSDNNTKVTRVKEKLLYPDHPDRFDTWPQLLCLTGLTGRCYWEVQWNGHVYIAVSHKGIRGRKEDNITACGFGFNAQSWSLECSDHGFFVYHNNTRTHLRHLSSSSGTVGVYVDCDAGSLSFYSSERPIHLHTFSTSFSEPLLPGFMLDFDSTVSLLQ